MKKGFLSFAIITMGVASIVFSSCSNDLFDMDDFDSANQMDFIVVDNLRLSDMPKNWKSQFEFAKHEHGINRGENAILLVDYHYLEALDSEHKIDNIINEMFSEEMATVFETKDGNKIVNLGEYYNSLPSDANTPFDKTKAHLDSIIIEGMHAFELTWKQNDAYYHSIAIVQDDEQKNCVFYDNIGIFTSIINRGKNTRSTLLGKMPNAITFREQIEDEYRQELYIHDYDQNTFGGRNWEYQIAVRSTFNSSGTLVESRVACSANADNGWDCSSCCQKIAGTEYQNDYAKYIYAWAYCYGTVSITVNTSLSEPFYEINCIGTKINKIASNFMHRKDYSSI